MEVNKKMQMTTIKFADADENEDEHEETNLPAQCKKSLTGQATGLQRANAEGLAVVPARRRASAMPAMLVLLGEGLRLMTPQRPSPRCWLQPALTAPEPVRSCAAAPRPSAA